MGSRRRSWSTAIVLACIAFAVLVLVYGVIPSEFIGWFNKRYNDINMRRFVRDPIVVVWHAVAFGAMIVGAIKFQKRQEAAAKAAPADEGASAYGRPLKEGS